MNSASVNASSATLEYSPTRPRRAWRRIPLLAFALILLLGSAVAWWNWPRIAYRAELSVALWRCRNYRPSDMSKPIALPTFLPVVLRAANSPLRSSATLLNGPYELVFLGDRRLSDGRCVLVNCQIQLRLHKMGFVQLNVDVIEPCSLFANPARSECVVITAHGDFPELRGRATSLAFGRAGKKESQIELPFRTSDGRQGVFLLELTPHPARGTRVNVSIRFD
jgi:hypothetical protein